MAIPATTKIRPKTKPITKEFLPLIYWDIGIKEVNLEKSSLGRENLEKSIFGNLKAGATRFGGDGGTISSGSSITFTFGFGGLISAISLSLTKPKSVFSSLWISGSSTAGFSVGAGGFSSPSFSSFLTSGSNTSIPAAFATSLPPERATARISKSAGKISTLGR